MSMLFIIISTIQLLQLTYSQISCEVPYSCSNQTIAATDQHIVISGYKGAYGVNTIIQNSGQQIFCRTAFGCSFASLIHATQSDLSVPVSIWCEGLYSCAHISQIISTQSIGCPGPQSCSHSLISAQMTVYASGEQSCRGCVITNTTDIRALAPYSLYKANISSIDAFTMFLYGDHSGFGADVHCQEGHTCTLTCYGRGCHMLYVHGSGTININKPSVEAISPITDKTHYDESKIDSNLWIEPSVYSLIEQQCNESPYTFDDYLDQGVDVISDALTVCCRGYRACHKISIDINYINNLDKVPLLCASTNACATTKPVGCHLSNPQGPIYCIGRSACDFQVITTNDTVICGADACGSATITAPIIHCNSDRSCGNAVISSNGDLVIYAVGMESAWRASITCNDGDHCTLYCRGENTCSDISTFECIGTCAVECDNDSGCPPGYTPQTAQPTAPTQMTLSPTQLPTAGTSLPTTFDPSLFPTKYPTKTPTAFPSEYPTKTPTKTPTLNSTSFTTKYPSKTPTSFPSKYPTSNPTSFPSKYPTKRPTSNPTTLPTKVPTSTPTDVPTSFPTKYPTEAPTSAPTPLNAVTKNYEIKIDINNCEVNEYTDCNIDPDDLNDVIESALSVEANVELINWLIVDDELIIHLSVTTGAQNVLTPDFITNHVEGKVKDNDDFGEVETEEKDEDFNDIAPSDGYREYSMNIITVIAVAVCGVCCIGILCYCFSKRTVLKKQVKIVEMMSPDDGLSDDNTQGNDINTKGYDVNTNGNDIGTTQYGDIIGTKGNDIDAKEDGDVVDTNYDEEGAPKHVVSDEKNDNMNDVLEDTESEEDNEDMYDDVVEGVARGGGTTGGTIN